MRKLSRRAASIALAAAMLFTTVGVSQKKVEAASYREIICYRISGL